MRIVQACGWIQRLSFYVSAIAIVAAAWELLSVLYAPAPRLPSYDINSLQAAVAEDTEAVVSKREGALGLLTGEAESEVSPGPSLHAFGDGGSDFESARNRALSALEERIGPVEQYASPGVLPPLLALDEALDEADSLYQRDIELYVAAAEGILRQGMALERSDHIRRLAYNRLVTTVRTDVISYRTLESLQIQKAKEQIYETEFRETRDTIRRTREGTRAERDKLYGNLQSAGSEALGALIDRVGASLSEGEAGSFGCFAENALLQDILSRLAGFEPLNLPSDRGLEVRPTPSLDHRAWLNSESGLGEEFLKDIKEDKRGD
jgi:hypothetical protein